MVFEQRGPRVDRLIRDLRPPDIPASVLARARAAGRGPLLTVPDLLLGGDVATGLQSEPPLVGQLGPGVGDSILTLNLTFRPVRAQGARVRISGNSVTISPSRQGLQDEVVTDLGRELVRLLQSGRSRWPVRTGLSRRSFSWRYLNGRLMLTNSTNYAKYVEERFRAAQRTVTSGRTSLFRVAVRAAGGGRPSAYQRAVDYARQLQLLQQLAGRLIGDDER